MVWGVSIYHIPWMARYTRYVLFELCYLMFCLYVKTNHHHPSMIVDR